MKFIFISTGLKMPNSITQSSFFYKICILIKQVNHISKRSVRKAEIPRKIIHSDLRRPVI